MTCCLCIKGRNLLDAKFETSWAPFDEIEGSLGLQRCNGCSAVSGNDIAAVEKSDSHVLAIARIADNHLVVWLEAYKQLAG